MKASSSITLRSHPENIALLEQYLTELCDRYSIGSETYSDILISLTEAVNNAIVHGNECNDEKLVHIVHLYKESDNALIFRVRHDGNSFDPDQVPDPTHREHRRKQGGRGIFVMKALSEELNYRDDGCTVDLHFKIC